MKGKAYEVEYTFSMEVVLDEDDFACVIDDQLYAKELALREFKHEYEHGHIDENNFEITNITETDDVERDYSFIYE